MKIEKAVHNICNKGKKDTNIRHVATIAILLRPHRQNISVYPNRHEAKLVNSFQMFIGVKEKPGVTNAQIFL